jgi:hypothetical protein
MEHYTIKSEKQENGLWGLPLRLQSIKGNIMFKDDYQNSVISAVMTAFAECHRNEDFSYERLDNAPFFYIKADTNYSYKMDNFGLIGNTLYFMTTDEDKKQFNRLLKLKKLKKLI